MNIRSAKKGTQMKGVPTDPIQEKKNTPQQPTDEAPQKTSPLVAEDYGGNGLVQEYMQFLGDHNVTKEDIFKVLNTIMTTGYLEWDTSINNGRTPLRFRMRPVWAEDLIAKHVDELSADKNLSMMRFSNALRALNLAASLVLFGDREFDVKDEESFEESFAFINSLPYPVFTAVTTQLAVFDRAVAVAMSDWAMKNFTEPQKVSS